MKTPLDILHVEDNVRDAELIHTLLHETGMPVNIIRVDSRELFMQHISSRKFHLLLCDYNLPSFDGKSALVLAKEYQPETPFIFVSGTIGEERAIEALKQGATDYVIKDRLERLVPAVQRALREQEEKFARKSLEEQLLHAQRMESIGTLAGGIAHDFNNILGIIMGHASLLERLRNDPIKFSDSTHAILQATRRGAALVKQLLTFSRKTHEPTSTIRVNDAVSETVKLLQETLSKTITVSFTPGNSLPPIAVDATQLQQILLNLCVNARDAMPNGGILSFTTYLADGETLQKKYIKATHDVYVAITVADSGTGMSDEIRKRIFEPFFTTKTEGKGTGLGLSVVFGIVEGSNGFVDVESELGKGTTFSLYFPAAISKVSKPEPSSSSVDSVTGGTETILIIEDERVIGELLGFVLTNKGYKILYASDGEEGVEMFKNNMHHISLIISDYGLPKFNGHEVFRRLQKMKSELKFILASGYIEPEQHAAIKTSGITKVIQKPYDPLEVVSVVREVLDKK